MPLRPIPRSWSGRRGTPPSDRNRHARAPVRTGGRPTIDGKTLGIQPAHQPLRRLRRPPQRRHRIPASLRRDRSVQRLDRARLTLLGRRPAAPGARLTVRRNTRPDLTHHSPTVVRDVPDNQATNAIPPGRSPPPRRPAVTATAAHPDAAAAQPASPSTADQTIHRRALTLRLTSTNTPGGGHTDDADANTGLASASANAAAIHSSKCRCSIRLWRCPVPQPPRRRA